MEETEGWIEVTIRTVGNKSVLYEFVEYDNYDLEEMNLNESTSNVNSDMMDFIIEIGSDDGIIYDDYQKFGFSVKIIDYPPEEFLTKKIQRLEYKLQQQKDDIRWYKKQLKNSQKKAKETEW